MAVGTRADADRGNGTGQRGSVEKLFSTKFAKKNRQDAL